MTKSGRASEAIDSADVGSTPVAEVDEDISAENGLTKPPMPVLQPDPDLVTRPMVPLLQTVEQIAQRRRWHAVPNADRHPDYWKFAATKAFKNWPQGFEMSEADFDAAVREMDNQAIR